MIKRDYLDVLNYAVEPEFGAIGKGLFGLVCAESMKMIPMGMRISIPPTIYPVRPAAPALAHFSAVLYRTDNSATVNPTVIGGITLSYCCSSKGHTGELMYRTTYYDTYRIDII